MEVKDGPHLLSIILAQAIVPTASQSLNIIEIAPQAATWEFPNQLPPFSAVCIVMEGRPGTIYTTKWRLLGPDRATIAEVPGPDLPFTTQIKRINVIIQLRKITEERVITKPATYTIQFYVNSELAGETTLPIAKIDKPPNAPSAPSS